MKLVLASLKVLAVTAVSLFCFGVAVCLAVIVAARYSEDGIPTFYGRKVLTIEGWSMEPTLASGDVIVIQPLATGDLAAEGDVITFRSQSGTLATHRIMGVISINGMPVWYVTKGDANDSNDLGTVPVDTVVGRYQWRIPYGGYALHFMERPVGIATLVITPGILLLVVIAAGAFKALRDASTGHSEEEASGEGGGAVSP